MAELRGVMQLENVDIHGNNYQGGGFHVEDLVEVGVVSTLC